MTVNPNNDITGITKNTNSILAKRITVVMIGFMVIYYTLWHIKVMDFNIMKRARSIICIVPYKLLHSTFARVRRDMIENG